MSTITHASQAERIAGAPISWGVCEVPGWGHQLDPGVVLAQMREVGLVATEFGPEGFLPDHPRDKADRLAAAGLVAVGQFVPVVLHDPDNDPMIAVNEAITGLVAAGASTLVIAAATGSVGYDSRASLSEQQWQIVLDHLDRIADAAEAAGLRAVLHPHVGTMIENGAQTQRVLEGSRIDLCLDTGHLLIGGGDPVQIARAHPGRVGHVHLKDVHLGRAREVQTGTLTYAAAVAAGMYVPLGRGDVDIATIVGALEDAGYTGWYVLEQDTIVGAPGPRTDGAESAEASDPVANVRDSLDYLNQILVSQAERKKA